MLLLSFCFFLSFVSQGSIVLVIEKNDNLSYSMLAFAHQKQLPKICIALQKFINNFVHVKFWFTYFLKTTH